MKKLFLALALVAPIILTAQGFEGVIKFSMDYKGDQADLVKQQMPSSTTITIKGNNTKVVTTGGVMASMIGDVVNKGDEKTSYFIQAANKTVYKVKNDELKSDKKDDSDGPKVTKENSTAKILGYTCQKYKVETKSGINYVWATKDIDIGNVEFRGKVSYKGVEGVVMKQEMNITDQGMTFIITMTMVSFDKKSISDSEFAIPAEYTVKEEVPGLLKMQMGN